MKLNEKKNKKITIVFYVLAGVLVLLFFSAMVLVLRTRQVEGISAVRIFNLGTNSTTMFLGTVTLVVFLFINPIRKKFEWLFAMMLFFLNMSTYFKLLIDVDAGGSTFLSQKEFLGIGPYIFTLATICAAWFFIVDFTGTQAKWIKKFNIFFVAICSISAIVVMLNPVTHLYFRVLEDGNMVSTKFYIFSYVFVIPFIVASLIVALKTWSGQFQSVAILALILVPIVSGVVEALIPRLDINKIMVFFGCLILYFCIQARSTQEMSKQTQELDTARDIQQGMLSPEKFISKDNCAVINAYMDTAKEVGGDLYDYFMTDGRHLAFVVGDVSGKGVPAALFMTKAMTSLRTMANLGSGPAEVFAKTNNILREGNKNMSFITVWAGILDLYTGTLRYANAGHNPPIVWSDGEYKYLKGKPNLMMGIKTGYQYKEYEIKLNPDDRIFLYTDGITEEHDENDNLFGEDRLLDILNGHKESDGKEIIDLVSEDLAKFRGNNDPFDDRTMMMLRFNKRMEKDILKIEAKRENVDIAIKFVSDFLKEANVARKVRTSLMIVVDELFANVANYAYGDGTGDIIITLEDAKEAVRLIFEDHGMPFDPLTNKKETLDDPKQMLRQVGGLGIMMVKKIADEISYEYKDEKNILTVLKYKE